MIDVAFARWLDANVDGLAFTDDATAGNVFVGNEPAAPDLAVTVWARPGLTAVDRTPDRPGLHVIVRGNPYADVAGSGRRIANDLAVLTLDQTWLDDVYVEGLTPQQSGPTPLGRDALQRPRWALGYQLHLPTPITI